MKYKVLESFRVFLSARLRPETARVYCDRLSTLLGNETVVNTLDNLDMNAMINRLQSITYKNEFSQYKNALTYFCEFQNITLNREQQKKIGEFESHTKKKYRRLTSVEFQKMDRTIKHLKNKKLKFSFQTLLATGLRVSELSQITANECTCTNDEIIFSFTGKGGRRQTAKLSKKENKKLYDNVKEMIEDTKAERRVFYSSNYLQQKAKRYGFRCLDLRRASAKITYENTKSKEQVKQKLRHSNLKTTEIYLKSKVNIKPQTYSK